MWRLLVVTYGGPQVKYTKQKLGTQKQNLEQKNKLESEKKLKQKQNFEQKNKTSNRKIKLRTGKWNFDCGLTKNCGLTRPEGRVWEVLWLPKLETCYAILALLKSNCLTNFVFSADVSWTVKRCLLDITSLKGIVFTNIPPTPGTKFIILMHPRTTEFAKHYVHVY